MSCWLVTESYIYSVKATSQVGLLFDQTVHSCYISLLGRTVSAHEPNLPSIIEINLVVFEIDVRTVSVFAMTTVQPQQPLVYS